ncbi:hypothetical protein CDL12_15818 [Handroanthus impetiginosus]|uniref:Uncharacterized protein n=1 Tax=Handroanthus impetiginosus TaxID=429701 RepID=A0A2G9H246_9LAMI|nr:hypothetical protein CDL12_15818 [Handroanthus impetiginosus]
MVRGIWSFKGIRQWRLSSLKSRKMNIQVWIVDDVIFKIVYVVEAIVLVSTLCFFYLCCGCHF